MIHQSYYWRGRMGHRPIMVGRRWVFGSRPWGCGCLPLLFFIGLLVLVTATLLFGFRF